MSQNRIAQPRGLLSSHGVLCFFLAIMVFAWGTNYKLSLYKAERPCSPAKVCTRGSDATKKALNHAADVRTVAQAPPSNASISSLLQGIEDFPIDRLCDEVVSDLSPLGRAPILYLRPPPGELHSLA
jgi:hypothetical protein